MSEKKTFEHRGRSIHAELRTTATPQQVWEAWANPENFAQWFVDRATGEPKVGSTFTWFFDKFQYVMPFEVIEAVPGERFVLRWSDPLLGRPPGMIDVTIAREGGVTVLRLVNSGFQEGAEWDEEYQGTVSGWQTALALLKLYLENYFGKPKTMIMALRPASYRYQQLLPLFTTPDGLGKWLTRSGAVGMPGDRCELALKDDGSVTGRVLAITRHEAALSWEEIHGALELKGFSMGPAGRMICVRVTSWGAAAARMAEIEQHMGTALERLAAVLGDTASLSAQAGEETR
ncbi:MAG TPA: SRPBCC domain-containing protein [Candidatus Acidoferrales bacterium]|jgi:uncharacterized protein YndB with AHSA1/START domain|nr:SRPBCC domain-containing protein [Candidatus Acidoferrales bacterium]